MKTLIAQVSLCLIIFIANNLATFSKNGELLQGDISLVESIKVFKEGGIEERHTYTYDIYGNKLTDFTETLDNGNGQWVNSIRTTSSYNGNGNRLTFLTENWVSGQWANTNRTSSTYNTNGNRLTNLLENWLNGKWANTSRNTSTYNSNGKLITDLSEKWDNGQWVNTNRSSSTYDANGIRLTNLSEKWDKGQWLNTNRSTFTYTSGFKVESELAEKWDTSGKWVNYSRFSFTYDANGNNLTWLLENWEKDQWVNVSRRTNTYDTDNKKLTEIVENWLGGTWINANRYSNTYHSTGKWLTNLTENWDTTGKWVNYTRYSWTYDANANVKTINYELSDLGQWINKNWYLSFISEKSNSYSMFGYKIEVVWKTVTSVSDVSTDDLWLSCFPNPTTNSINISYSISRSPIKSISITNSLGIEVANFLNSKLQMLPQDNIQFDVSNLPSGIYKCNLNTETNRISGSFIIIK